MKLTEKQLECQRLGSDKTLSFGCIYKYNSGEGVSTIYPNDYERFDDEGNLWVTYKDFGLYNNDNNNEMIDSDEYEVIGHPITRGRICYLKDKNRLNPDIDEDLRRQIEVTFQFIPSLYDKTILERTEELIDLVLSFLQSLDAST